MAVFAKDLLSGQHIAISGGLGALGLGIVKGLTDHGALVSINDIVHESIASDTLAHAGVPETVAAYTRADLTKPSEVERFLRTASESFGPITTALCHAGVVASSSILDVSECLWDRILDTNLKAALLLGSQAARMMREKGVRGHLIFTSSWVSWTPWPSVAPYNASKAAVNQLMRSFARELAEYGIRANAIAPGIVDAGMARKQWDTEPDYRARAQRAIPLGEMQPLQSVVDTFLFLCSDAASYTTGSVLVVDGGCSLYPMD